MIVPRPDSGDFVRLETFALPTEASLVLSHLVEVGIPAFIGGELTATTFTGNPWLGAAVPLYVARLDVKRARDILDALRADDAGDFADEAEAGVWVCELCGEAVPEAEESCPSCGSRR